MTTIPRKSLTLLLFLCVWMTASMSSAQVHSQQWKHILRQTDEAFYKTDEARRIGEQLMLYQRVTGGWPKNTNMVSPLTPTQREAVLADKQRTDDSTTDNEYAWYGDRAASLYDTYAKWAIRDLWKFICY